MENDRVRILDLILGKPLASAEARNRAALLKALLLVRGTQQTIVINVPCYLSPRATPAGVAKRSI